MTDSVSKSQREDSRNFSPERRSRTSLTSRDEVIARLRKGRKYRATYLSSNLDRELAYQLRRLRDKMGWSQMELAEKMETSQNAISRLESPGYGKASLSILKRLAEIFDVALEVRFIPFGKWVKFETGTPYYEYGLGPESNNPKTFSEEEESGDLETDIGPDSKSLQDVLSGQSGPPILIPIEMQPKPSHPRRIEMESLQESAPSSLLNAFSNAASSPRKPANRTLRRRLRKGFTENARLRRKAQPPAA
ncbi:MAG TPA: helix-turn-helix transcriptional regulator [Terracidiphilus sp.]|nr:helix-turn-helix transcriptional regulator [Terracidiphilus sp.]